MNEQEADFTGRQTIAHFFEAILKKLSDEESDTVEMEMDIRGATVSFSIQVTQIDIKTAREAA